jgi:hypothetical protein
MQLDALSAALSMTFSDKQTLAARWFIGLSVVCQCAAFSAIGYVMSTLPATMGFGDLSAFRFYWGTKFEHSHQVPKSFWLYFAYRVSNELHNSWLALSWTVFFDLSEHDKNKEITERWKEQETTSDILVDDHNAQISQLILHDFYTSQPGTVFTNCIALIGFSITPFIAIETLIGQCENVTGTREWGQRAAIIPPVIGTLRWLYFQKKEHSCK